MNAATMERPYRYRMTGHPGCGGGQMLTVMDANRFAAEHQARGCICGSPMIQMYGMRGDMVSGSDHKKTGDDEHLQWGDEEGASNERIRAARHPESEQRILSRLEKSMTNMERWIAKQARQGVVVNIGPERVVLDSGDRMKLAGAVSFLLTGGRMTFEDGTTEPDEYKRYWATLRLSGITTRSPLA